MTRARAGVLLAALLVLGCGEDTADVVSDPDGGTDASATGADAGDELDAGRDTSDSGSDGGASADAGDRWPRACTEDGDCDPGTPCCTSETCGDGYCIADCGPVRSCDTGFACFRNRCLPSCVGDEDCRDPFQCDTDEGVCVGRDG